QSTSDFKERELKVSAREFDFVVTIDKRDKISKKHIKKMIEDLKELRYGPPFYKRYIAEWKEVFMACWIMDCLSLP
ncbi:hypothetical protein ACFLYA_02255, partial [Candidatus Dependentiae bacterium]